MTAPCDACPFAACDNCRWQNWQPGDEIYSQANHVHSRYIFNYRDEDPTDACSCPDAASWPEPRAGHHRLSDDPLQRFVTDWHAWDAAGRPEESAA